jgi:hypothetical protein
MPIGRDADTDAGAYQLPSIPACNKYPPVSPTEPNSPEPLSPSRLQASERSQLLVYRTQSFERLDSAEPVPTHFHSVEPKWRLRLQLQQSQRLQEEREHS